MATPMPALAAPRNAPTLEMVRNMTGGFDVDAFHVMDRRDDELVADEILHGSLSAAFIYNFEIQGKQVCGVSVVGARHLAAHYRGLRHRIVASTQKIGELFTFKSYPSDGMPMSVSCAVVAELAQEPDYYEVVIEIEDVKAGNKVQIERREARYEYRRDGSPYERPNYQTIAQSKAYRNGVLAVVPQDVIILWRDAQLKLKKGETITGGLIAEKRRNVLQFAARHAIAFDRRRIEALTLDQIAGLGDAARDGALPAFVNAARALGLEVGHGEAQALPEPETVEVGPQRARGRGRPAKAPAGGNDSGGDKTPPGPPPPLAENTSSNEPPRGRLAFE